MKNFAIFIPVFCCAVLIYADIVGTDVFSSFTEGVNSGLKTLKSVLPSLLLILTAVSMLRASGGFDSIVFIFEPIVSLTGFPAEVIPVALMKPFSGSGASAMFESVVKKCGADSFSAKLSAIICSSSETAFYTFGVYLSGLNGKFGKILLCSLFTDLFSFAAAYVVLRLMSGSII